MDGFTRLTGLAAPLPQANIDTDIIFPARFLLITAKRGLGRYAFYAWRYAADGTPLADFPLNQPRFAGAPILVAGDNFGGGSSREQAAWALMDMGVRCIISTRFGEIFQANCFKNGMLPVMVSPEWLGLLLADAQAGRPLDIDLREQTVRRDNGAIFAFAIEPWRREALLNGWDEIAMITTQEGARIDAFETRQRAQSPWLYTGD